MEVARRTATSTGMQASSIIRVTDPEIKNKIAEICNQEYVARVPELLIFIVDQYRNNQIAKEQNYFTETAKDMDRFFAAFTDAYHGTKSCNSCRIYGVGNGLFGKHPQ